ncbi:MAG TPA: stage III sporulation protein AD [Bacillota bacterium]|nr:stage III sporulation protein AD [Bacillota bacterium]HOL08744.1 stage III sporulation protein AD [Bacillota bacterium]HPO96353.1 stage III sporulation protein AD [Bacillota bacterium]
MPFFATLGFILLVTILLIILRHDRPEIAMLLALAATAVIMVGLLKNVSEILLVFEDLAVKANVNTNYLKLIIKIVGIAYLAGFGAQICKDAGENSMAAKIELAGKIFILTMGIPIMVGILDLILKVF